jgi:DnaJ domain
MPQDFYGLLGISRSATKEQVRNAYLSLARKYHPDINQELATDDLLKEVNHAYEILSDEESRTAYNLALREDEPLEFTAKLYSLKSVAVACSVTAVLGGTLGYSLTFLQPKPDPVVVVVSPPALPPDRAEIEKVLESIQDVPALHISAVVPFQQEIPTASNLVMDKKRPLIFGSNIQALADSSTKELRVAQIRSVPVTKKASKVPAPRKAPVLARVKNAKTVKPSVALASKPDLAKSPPLKVSSSPEAILSAISISMEDGSSVSADTLLKVDTRIWKWNRGRYRKKLSKFISVLIESKDIALASKQSGLSLREIRFLVKQV